MAQPDALIINLRSADFDVRVSSFQDLQAPHLPSLTVSIRCGSRISVKYICDEWDGPSWYLYGRDGSLIAHETHFPVSALAAALDDECLCSPLTSPLAAAEVGALTSPLVGLAHTWRDALTSSHGITNADAATMAQAQALMDAVREGAMR